MLFYVMDLISGTSLDSSTPNAGRTAVRVPAGSLASEYRPPNRSLRPRPRRPSPRRKPSNFVLDQDGRLWLTDFGLAKLLDDPPLTAAGEWLGTLRVHRKPAASPASVATSIALA